MMNRPINPRPDPAAWLREMVDDSASDAGNRALTDIAINMAKMWRILTGAGVPPLPASHMASNFWAQIAVGAAKDEGQTAAEEGDTHE